MKVCHVYAYCQYIVRVRVRVQIIRMHHDRMCVCVHMFIHESPVRIGFSSYTYTYFSCTHPLCMHTTSFHNIFIYIAVNKRKEISKMQRRTTCVNRTVSADKKMEMTDDILLRFIEELENEDDCYYGGRMITEQKLPRLMFRPVSKRRIAWNTLVMIYVVFHALYVPFRIAFWRPINDGGVEVEQPSLIIETPLLVFFQVMGDLLMLFDLALDIRTPLMSTQKGKYIIDQTKIIKHLFFHRPFFWVSIIAAIPSIMVDEKEEPVCSYSDRRSCSNGTGHHTERQRSGIMHIRNYWKQLV